MKKVFNSEFILRLTELLGIFFLFYTNICSTSNRLHLLWLHLHKYNYIFFILFKQFSFFPLLAFSLICQNTKKNRTKHNTTNKNSFHCNQDLINLTREGSNHGNFTILLLDWCKSLCFYCTLGIYFKTFPYPLLVQHFIISREENTKVYVQPGGAKPTLSIHPGCKNRSYYSLCGTAALPLTAAAI